MPAEQRVCASQRKANHEPRTGIRTDPPGADLQHHRPLDAEAARASAATGSPTRQASSCSAPATRRTAPTSSWKARSTSPCRRPRARCWSTRWCATTSSARSASSATCRAPRPRSRAPRVEVLRISRDVFVNVIRSNPDAAIALVRILADRLAKTTAQLRRMAAETSRVRRSAPQSANTSSGSATPRSAKLPRLRQRRAQFAPPTRSRAPRPARFPCTGPRCARPCSPPRR